jgi:sugar phosphate isomerase/epimerase
MIYLATPYTHADPAVMHARFERACEHAGKLMQQGLVVFCPIAHTHPIAVRCDLPRDWVFWRQFDEAFIAASKRVVVVKMPGWEVSAGIAAEIEIAQRLHKPVEYLDDVV